MERQSRYHLRLLFSTQLAVPSSICDARSFAVLGPNRPIWTNLLDFLRNPALSTDILKRDFKTLLFAHYTAPTAHYKLSGPLRYKFIVELKTKLLSTGRLK